MLPCRRIGSLALASLVLACTRASSPVSSSTPEPPVEPVPDVKVEPLTWHDVEIVDERICATDERELAWCWDADALAGEPQPAVLHAALPGVTFSACGVPNRLHTLLGPRCAEEGDAIRCEDDSRSWTVTLSEPADELEITGTYACARHPIGQVSCWTDAGDVAWVDGLEDVREIVVGEAAACALQGEGRLSCWAAGSASTFTLAVPETTTEPAMFVEIVPPWSRSGTIRSRWPMPELHSRLHDRFDPLFAPYALDLDLAALVYRRGR